MRLLHAVLPCLGPLTLTAACGREQAQARNVLPKARHDFIVLGMDCFWGADNRMSELPGVVDVESGYANGEIEGSYKAVLAQERARVPA